MKLLVASDFHGSVEASRQTALKAKNVRADVIIICGDITHFGSLKDTQKILAPLIALELPLLYVPGNCDPPQLAEVQIKGASCIHGKCQNYRDVSFLGLGGALASSFYSLFELGEEGIMKALRQGEKECHQNKWFILVSHSPPINTQLDLASSKVHAGSVSLRRFIEEKKPHVVFCGHIHEARGIDRIGETRLANPGPVRHGNCAIANLTSRIELRLDSL